MFQASATAIAHPNIALIKYWGDRVSSLRLPANGSISMNLDGLITRTEVRFESSLTQDYLVLNGQELTGPALERVHNFLNLVRAMAQISTYAEVLTINSFPTGVGIASSAAAFAALSLAASQALALNLDEPALSRLARQGSGSACRSVPGGFVEWQVGEKEEESYAFSIAAPDYWNLTDVIAVVNTLPKTTGSSEGHAAAWSSPLQQTRVMDTPRRLGLCRDAILKRDFNTLADIVEADSNLMHAVMITSTPPLFYWEPASLRLVKLIPKWRQEGLPACYTLDAGPNVHILCPAEYAAEITSRLEQVEGVIEILKAGVGPAAHLL